MDSKNEGFGRDFGHPVAADSDINRLLFGPQVKVAQQAPGIGIGARWFDRGEAHCLSPLFDEEAAPAFGTGSGILAMGAWRTEHPDDWVKIDSVVDSGAAAPVAPPSMAPGFATRPSEGSRQGRSFTTAAGTGLKNLGEQELNVVTDSGMDTTVLFPLADVPRPLMSVSAICDHGNRVIFGRGGGIIQHIASGMEVPFERRGGVYVLGLWLQEKKGASPTAAAAPSAASPGFTRR